MAYQLICSDTPFSLAWYFPSCTLQWASLEWNLFSINLLLHNLHFLMALKKGAGVENIVGKGENAG